MSNGWSMPAGIIVCETLREVCNYGLLTMIWYLSILHVAPFFILSYVDVQDMQKQELPVSLRSISVLIVGGSITSVVGRQG